MKTLAQRLKETLILKGISARELAEEVGISESSISRTLHEKGKPTRTNLQAICKVLGVNKEWLLHGTGQKEANEVENSPLLVEKSELIANTTFLLERVTTIINELEKHNTTISEVQELREAYKTKAELLTELKNLKS